MPRNSRKPSKHEPGQDLNALKEELLGLAARREVTELELTTSISVDSVATEVVGQDQEHRDGAPSPVGWSIFSTLFESQQHEVECTPSKVKKAVPVVDTPPKVEKKNRPNVVVKGNVAPLVTPANETKELAPVNGWAPTKPKQATMSTNNTPKPAKKNKSLKELERERKMKELRGKLHEERAKKAAAFWLQREEEKRRMAKQAVAEAAAKEEKELERELMKEALKVRRAKRAAALAAAKEEKALNKELEREEAKMREAEQAAALAAAKKEKKLRKELKSEEKQLEKAAKYHQKIEKAALKKKTSAEIELQNAMKRAKEASVIANKVVNYDYDDDDTRSVSSRLSRFSLSSKRSTRSTRSTRSMLYFKKTEKKNKKSKSSLGRESIKIPGAVALPMAAITIIEEEQEDRRDDEVSILQEKNFDTAPTKPSSSITNKVKSKFGKNKSINKSDARSLQKMASRELTSFDERTVNDDCSHDDDAREQPDHFGDQPPASVLGCLAWFMGNPEGEESLASHSWDDLILNTVNCDTANEINCDTANEISQPHETATI